MIEQKYFIATYTNEVKSYCDEQFFINLSELSGGNLVHIVDNSNNDIYLQMLKDRFSKFSNFHFHYINVEIEPKYSLFHRRVTASCILLRDKFLATNLPYFLTIESDVIPPKSLLKNLDLRIVELDRMDKQWGMLGGLFHLNFHQYFLTGLQNTYHALSGCTVYKRSLIEKFPFRWSDENLQAFPDAWISKDAKQDYNFYNDHNIRCGHLENPKTGTRYTEPI